LKQTDESGTSGPQDLCRNQTKPLLGIETEYRQRQPEPIRRRNQTKPLLGIETP